MGELTGEGWERYGRAVIRSMQEVLAEAPEDVHALLLETADYWLSLGLAIGLRRPADAERLLALIHGGDAVERDELDADAAAFSAEALG
ncbi:MAG: hypothetical protein ACYC9X_12620 [Dehalococcoidia bacterium]